MAASDPVRRANAAAVSSTIRWSGHDDPRLPEMYRDLRAAALLERTKQIMEMDPPLTVDQVEQIVAVLRSRLSVVPGRAVA